MQPAQRSAVQLGAPGQRVGKGRGPDASFSASALPPRSAASSMESQCPADARPELALGAVAARSLYAAPICSCAPDGLALGAPLVQQPPQLPPQIQVLPQPEQAVQQHGSAKATAERGRRRSDR
eukprot:5017638-Alexandrium_andersonii.AAC.1